jgi:hypothetical protein
LPCHVARSTDDNIRPNISSLATAYKTREDPIRQLVLAVN